jgi:hypothetical protein
LFVVSVYVVGIIPIVVHDMTVDGRAESVTPVVGMVSGHNAAETVVTKSVGETALAKSVEVLSTVDTRIHPTQ